MLIGLIADTHSLLQPGVVAAFEGVEAILHAGDVGDRLVLEALERIAPVSAVRGNVDPPELGLPAEIRRQWGGVTVHVSHGHELGSPRPNLLLARYAERVVVYGHTHKAVVFRDGDRLVVNPGAAGPRRFGLVPSVARLAIRGGRAEVEIVRLT
jgi:hypothetical protein